jgi:NTP pyrophosphatase (non-canonical NTP hydrolase)
MDFKDYQKAAAKTDQVPGAVNDETAASLVIPMLGLAGETGQLLTEYKKHVRDGAAHKLFKSRVAEELGDLLWYVSNVATKFGLSLEDIATKNLLKAQARWAPTAADLPSFDAGFPEKERLPRQFVVTLAEEESKDGRPKVQMRLNGVAIGSMLGDNSYDPDGYRFHDVFHLSYAAILGWSPNLRGFLKRKRKSKPLLDDVEDGGRAKVIEEGIAALVFDYARAHNYLDGVSEIDYELLRTIKSMTSHLEVSRASAADWEHAILRGFKVWRAVVDTNGGIISVDLDNRTLAFVSAPAPIPVPAQ